jgi:ABC-type nitrate/sulfonate/bicarbonate transport system ATPase subunit
VIAIDGVTKRYGASVIVEDVSLTIADGELVSLIGHSGCGKSTVLAMVAGLSEITAGEIRLAGEPIRGPGLDRGMVFQTPCLFPWLDVLANVRLAADEARAERALRDVGLGDALHARPGDLSAGMRQRAALARAFALEPRTLLLDEPFGMLDSLTRAELQDLVVSLPHRPTTLLVTHDIDEALLLSDRIAVMTDGPRAKIRTILDVPFGKQRDRARVVQHPSYERLRDELLQLLN